MKKFVVSPCQENHGETLVIVDADTDEILAESPAVLDFSSGDAERAPWPAASNVYGPLFAQFAAAPALATALRDTLDAFRMCIGSEAFAEFAGTSTTIPGARNEKIVAALALLKSLE